MTPTDTHDTPDTPDEVALPAFEDALWAALRAEHARLAGPLVGTAPSSTSTTDDVEGLDAGPAIVVPVDAPRRRHAALRRGLAAAAAVAVLAGIAVVVATGDDGSTTVAGPSTEAPTTVPLTLEERASAAMLAVLDDTVVRADVTGPKLMSAPYTQFTDARTGVTRQVWFAADGRVLAEQGATRFPDSESNDPEGAIVDHCARLVTNGWGMRESTVLDSIGSDTERGIWVADGTEVVDGRELIRLRTWATEADMPPPDPVTEDWERPTPDEWDPTMATYLDPETLLPVVTRYGIGQPDESRVSYTMLPRDDASLAEVLVSVPAGYAQEPETQFVTPLIGPPDC